MDKNTLPFEIEKNILLTDTGKHVSLSEILSSDILPQEIRSEISKHENTQPIIYLRQVIVVLPHSKTQKIASSAPHMVVPEVVPEVIPSKEPLKLSTKNLVEKLVEERVAKRISENNELHQKQESKKVPEKPSELIVVQEKILSSEKGLSPQDSMDIDKFLDSVSSEMKQPAKNNRDPFRGDDYIPLPAHAHERQNLKRPYDPAWESTDQRPAKNPRMFDPLIGTSSDQIFNLHKFDTYKKAIEQNKRHRLNREKNMVKQYIPKHLEPVHYMAKVNAARRTRESIHELCTACNSIGHTDIRCVQTVPCILCNYKGTITDPNHFSYNHAAIDCCHRCVVEECEIKLSYDNSNFHSRRYHRDR